MEELLSEVNVIFHCAATVRFDEPLKDALLLNVMGTQQLLRLAHQMKNLEALIHVSTAYSNCNRRHIEEVFYPVPVEPKKLLDLVGWMDGSLIEAITPNLIGDWPNTYTFSKALTEYLIQQEKGDLNVAIVRPSIVGASWQEPFPGWIDNFNNINGFLVAAAKGVVRTVKCNPTDVADFIPVDLAVNLTITIGWYTAVHRPKSPMIYNCTSGGLNSLYWGDLEINVRSSFNKNPLEKPFRIPEVTLTSSHLVHQYRMFVYHTSPAFLYDLRLRLIGKKPQAMKLLTRLEKAMGLLEYFTSHSWEWSSGHTNMLMKELNPKDKNLFPFDVRQVTWSEYLNNYCLGIKKYLLNEDMAGIPAAQQYIRKLKIIQCALKATLLVIIWLVFIARSQMARNVWYFVLSLCY
ncbi:fatty acyl-CoA reductase 1-like [Notechis scutatus]|uniref:Fatty acyl-CoA reductase n=1 Tax=Notechis scutatus TaxID=8663 RepID=A0A6J1V5J4_9SAUR|nr:fatty acyl-CoA reductase 1-like [Notechis scutatus]